MYISVKEAAQKWGINERRVRLLCQENRIEGLQKKGKSYLIPDNAPKPLDRRGKTGPIKINKSDVDFATYRKQYPNEEGYFGPYGGSFIDEKTKKTFAEIYNGYLTICKSAKFISELRQIQILEFFLTSSSWLPNYYILN